MKKKKVWLVGTIVIAMIFILAGCGKDKEQHSKKVYKQSNFGTSVEYDGNTYYWKDLENANENGQTSALIKSDSKGNETVLFEDYGKENLFIANDIVYFESYIANMTKVCRINLDGSDRQELTQGKIISISGDYIYVQGEAGITPVNHRNTVVYSTLKDAQMIGIVDKSVYYIVGNTHEQIYIGYMNNGENHSGLATFSVADYNDKNSSSNNITCYGFLAENGKLKIKLGNVQETTQRVQEGWIIEMDYDGTNPSKSLDRAIN